MAFGTMTLISSKQEGQGPLFVDKVTLVGDGAYSAGGTTGLKAALRALTKDSREPILVIPEDGKGYVVNYDYANEKLMVYEQDAGAALAEVTGSQSGVTYKLAIISR